MTVLTMPDGAVVDFGDMPPDQIKALIAKKFPEAAKPAPTAEQPANQQPYSGQLLPFSKDAQGNVSFDINAGLPGVIKRTIEFPADALRGKVDPLSDEGIARSVEAATVLSPVSAGARGGLGWAGAPAKKVPVKPPVPTSDELLSTGGFGFDMARQMDVRYDPKSVKNMALKLQSQLFKAGYRDTSESAKSVYKELKGLSKSPEPGAFASIDDLHSVRAALQNAAQNFNNPTGQRAAAIAIKEIDKFITSPDPQSVMAGPAAAAGGVWKDAMGNYAAGKRSDRLNGIEESTLRRAKANNSGLNVDNTIRQRVAALLDSPERRAGFSPEEIALLEQVANGTAARNTLRWAGNLLGGGGGIAGGIAGGAGFAAFGPAGTAAAVAAPLAAKLAGNKLTKNALRKVDTAVRERSPLYAQREATAPPPFIPAPGARTAMGRTLAAGPITAEKEALFKKMEEQQVSPQEYEEYLRSKWASDQGA